MPKATDAFVYRRISQDRSGAELGVERQLTACQALADAEGLRVIEVFTDNDVSAYSGKNRPQYESMLSRLNEVSHVIALRSDRFYRSLSDFAQFVEKCKAEDVVILPVDGDRIDPKSAGGMLTATMLAGLAQYESSYKADRVSAKSKQTIADGRHTGGVRPFGWHVLPRTPEEIAQKRGGRYSLNDREATALQVAIEDILERGRSLGSIARDWNDPLRAGGPLTTSTGGRWGATQLRQVLVRPRNAGISTYRGEVLAEDKIPPIISTATLRAMERHLNRNRLPNHTNKAVHLLSGIAECHCGRPVNAAQVGGRELDPETGKKAKHHVYRCQGQGAGHVAKRSAHVDQAVKLAILEWFSHPFLYKMESREEDRERAEELEQQTNELKRRLDEASDAYVSGRLEVNMLERVQRDVKEKRTAIEAEQAAIRGSRVMVPQEDFYKIHQQTTLFSEYQDWHIDDKREFIRDTLKIVLLSNEPKAPRQFDPHSVVVSVKKGLDPSEVRLDEEGREDPDSFVTGERVGAYWHQFETLEHFADRRKAYEAGVARIRRMEQRAPD
ncbi:recombinase family protein [Nesterenkonia sp. LB17]|uniref:recombinase family protein n=1 Tax=Nesterenkonia sp. LB17 TaxID=2901230 RepID=UPI001F4CF275|nr:recombinase family protein [Nesterenkonia sp. LB17]MCH8565683.1 recombinase family protein [Nesterenkonia sp. LB17]